MADTATEIITIDASPERVWDIAVDIANYPNWAHDIKDVTICLLYTSPSPRDS